MKTKITIAVIGGLIIVAMVALSGFALSGNRPKNTPSKTNADPPFTSQAPLGNWAEPWQNACEEASVIILENFYKGKNSVSPQEARRQILEVFSIKEDFYGESKDESMERIAELVNRADLTWNARVVENPTLDEMKAELAEHRPIIAPIYAPEINNPNYAGDGPDYHVVVISGYDDTSGEFIIQDPGTSRGEDLRFGYDVLYNAIHDYLGTENYQEGPRRVIFSSPN